MLAGKVMPVELESFIRRELKIKLETDLRQLDIVKEADLECCCYFYLRKYLQRDVNWKILTRRHSRITGHYIDLLVFRKLRPRMAIEFKWNSRKISDKDRESLKKAIKRLQVNKAYFICALWPGAEFQEIKKKTKSERYRLHEVVVKLDLPLEQKKEWERKRRLLYNPRPRKSHPRI